MLLDLSVGKLEHLEAVRVSCLGGLSICKVVNNLLVGIGLLYIVIVEVDDSIPIRVCLSPDSVGEDHFFLAIEECPLDLTVIANDLLLDRGVVWILLVVVLTWELHFVIFFLITFRLISILPFGRFF